MPEIAQNHLNIVVSKDKLRVEIDLRKTGPEDIQPNRVKETLEKLGVCITDEGTARIQDVAKLASEARRNKQDTLLIFSGKKAVAGQPAGFKPVEDRQQPGSEESGDASFDNRSCKIRTVKSGEVIGEYIPETPPQPGIDVYGKPIAGAPPLVRFELGPNVRLGDDGKTIYATCNGMIRVTRQGVSVVEQVKVDGDVDLKSGNVDAPSDVLITGNVAETFSVRSPKSITIKGMVEAASVEAGTHVIIAGGVAGKSRALIRAGGELQAKFLEEATIEATGDVIVTKEVLNCRIQTMGRLLVPRGPIIGGSVYARQGIEVLALGNDVDVPTQVAVGILPAALLEVAKMRDIIKKKREAATKVRNTVQPLLAQLKRLNPQQREKATELMYEADRLEEEANTLSTKKDEILRPYTPSGDREVCILVNRMVNRRVNLVFGDKVATILKPRRGPVKFVSRVVDRVESILMVDAVSGSTQILPSQPYEPEPSANEADTESTGRKENKSLGSQDAAKPATAAAQS